MYTASVAAMVVVYTVWGSTLVAFLTAMAVLFGGMELAIRGKVRRAASDAEPKQRRVWTRVVWLGLLFGTYYWMPTFGWGATRLLASLIVMLGCIELDAAVERKTLQRR
jgi:hypothetical protein